MRHPFTVACLASMTALFILACPPCSDAALKDLHPKVKVKRLQSYVPPPLPQKEDIPALTEKADKGDITATIALGRLYVEYHQSDEKIGKRLKQPAEAGNAEAQYIYALTAVNLGYWGSEERLEWLQKSAAQGYVPAISHVVDRASSLYGKEIPAQIAILLRKAASLGDAQSAKKLGELYLSGRDIAHDGVAAYVWLYLASHGFTTPARTEDPEDGNADSSSLDFLARTMTLDEIQQAETALAAWPKSLPPEIPFKEASLQRGERPPMRLDPVLSPKDIADLSTKADAGDNDARVRLGTMCLGGINVKKDPAKGVALIKQAADAGNEKALFALASLYQKDRPLGKNVPAARNIYERLAAKGNTDAYVALAELLLENEYDYPRDEEAMAADTKVALAWYTKAATQKNPRAMAALGRYYVERMGDRKLAAQWCEQSAAQGNIAALEALLGIAEQNRSAEEIYKWTSAYMSVLPPSDRINARQIMMRFASSLSDEDVLRLKKSVAAWLQKNPTLLEAAHARILAEEETVKGRDEEGGAPLHQAAAAGDMDQMRRLIDAKADVNDRNYLGKTPLHLAIEARHLDAARLLLQSGAIIDAQSQFWSTPLSIAVEGGDTEAVKFLLDAKGNPDISNPLLIAVEKNQTEIAVMLLNSGADPNVPNFRDERPLHYAVRDGRNAALAVLLQNGADPNVKDNFGDTPLHKAVKGKNSEAVKALIAAKTDVNAQNTMRNTPLLDALEKGFDDTTTLLLDAGAKGTLQNERGRDALRVAGMGSKPNVVKTLLEAEDDVKTAYPDLGVLLHAARSPEIVTILLTAKAAPNTVDEKGFTPLHRAAADGRTNIISLLLQAGADPNAATPKGRTPLHEVMTKREINLDVLKELLAGKADPNVRGEYSNPPLHDAAKKGNLEAVKILLAAKADPNFTDAAGRTAIDVTTDAAVFSALEKAGGKSAELYEAALYDELGRPMNKTAELAAANRNTPGSSQEKFVGIYLDTVAEAEEFNKTVTEEGKGNRSPYLARAVLMNVSPEELVERIKAGADPNVEDPVFGLALVQAIKQRRGTEMVRTLLENGADPNRKDKNDRKPLDFARVPEIIKILENAGGVRTEKD